MKKILIKTKEIIKNIKKHQTFDRCAIIAYYMLFSIFPIIILAGSIAQNFLSKEVFLNNIGKFLPLILYNFIEKNGIITNESARYGLFSFSFIIGIVSASKGGMSIIRGLEDADEGDCKNRWHIRLVWSLLFTTLLILCLVVTSIFIAFGEQINVSMTNNITGYYIFKLLRYIVALLFLWICVIIMYKYSLKRACRKKKVYIGALFCVLGWVVTTYLFGKLVFQFMDYSVVYGTIGGAVALMTWLHTCSACLLIGVEINNVLQ